MYVPLFSDKTLNLMISPVMPVNRQKHAWGKTHPSASSPTCFKRPLVEDTVLFQGKTSSLSGNRSESGYQKVWRRWMEQEILPDKASDIREMSLSLQGIPSVALSGEQKMIRQAWRDMLEERLLCCDAEGNLDTSKPMGDRAFQKVLSREGFVLNSKQLQAFLGQEARCLENQSNARANMIVPGITGQELKAILSSSWPATPEALLEKYQKEIVKLRQFLEKKQMVSLPDTPVRIVLDATLEESTPAAYDFDEKALLLPAGKDSAQFAERVKSHHDSAIPMIAAHELYPGHHTALSSAYPDSSPASLLADIGENSFFREGWATYAENLMREQGYLNTPKQLFTLVSHQRSLVLMAEENVSHHCKLSVSGSSTSEPSNENSQSGFAKTQSRERARLSAYYLGFIQILRLRQQAFDHYPNLTLREFHDRLLACPELPIPMMGKLAFGFEMSPITATELEI